MSFSSKKPLIKQSSIFDSEGKHRTGLSSKKVSFNSTILTDSDEENSIGKQNRRMIKSKDDDDDLLSMFKNELDDSDDDIMISSTKKGKPNPKPRHKPDTKAHNDNNDLLQTDDLDQTINPKRKPRPPPRTQTSQYENIYTDTHVIEKPKAPSRHHLSSKERPLSAKERKSEVEIKPQISLDDSDDDLVMSTSKKALDKKTTKTEIGDDLFGESESNKLKKNEIKENSFIESLFGSAKQKKENSLVKDVLQENADGKLDNEKNDESKLEKDSTKSSSLVDSFFGSSSKQKAKQNSVEEEEGKDLSDKVIQPKTQENKAKNKSMLDKGTLDFSDDEEDSKKQNSKPVIKERRMLGEDGKTMKNDYEDDTKESRRRLKEKSAKSMLDDSDDDDDDIIPPKRNEKTKKLITTDDDYSYRLNSKRTQKEIGKKSMLDVSDDDDEDIDMKKRDWKARKSNNDDYIRNSKKGQKEASQKSLLDDSDDDDMLQGRRDLAARTSVKDNGINKYNNRGKIPAPQPRKNLQNLSHEHRNKITDGGNFESDEEAERDTKQVPVPRTRRGHNQEADSRPITQSKLHYLDKNDDHDDDSDEGELQKFQKSRQKAIKKNEQMKSGKMAGWSSLDDSDDDDETIGKKITLTKGRPVSAKRNDNKTDNKEAAPTPSPRSPRPKPRHAIGNTSSDRHGERLEEKSRLNATNYNRDFNQSKSRSKNEREFSPPGRTTPQRPRSSQRRQNDWPREEEDVTHMFEDHVPDRRDIIGRQTEPDRKHTRDPRRPYSAVTPKRGPMKAEHRIEEMTKSPQLRKTLSGYDQEEDDWRFTPNRSVRKQRSSSLTNLHQTSQSDYMDYDSEDGGRRSSLDTESIRQTVYDNWLNRKNVTIKKELSKKALQKKKEEEIAKEKEEKKRSAASAFKSWSESKKGTIKEQQAQLKAKKKQEKDKELEKEVKKRDAAKYFESWKTKKDEIIKEAHKEKKKEQMEKKKKEEEEKLDKTISSKKSFENWKSRKDDVLKKQHKEKKKKEKLEETEKGEEEYTKTIKNADEYQKWVEKKGKPRKAPPPPTLTQRAWVPGSRNTADCIPTRVQPVILPPSSNRARTLSGTFKTTRKYYDY